MRARDNGATFVVASYPNLDQARDAMTALERSGIEAAKISLLGQPAEAARATTEVATSAPDTEVAGDVAKGAVAEMVAGTAVGGVASKPSPR